MSITLYYSNRLEVLAQELSQKMMIGPLMPMVPEIVVVQSRGMARWLALQIAGHLGVMANVNCPFPTSFVSEIFNKVMPKLQEGPSFEKNIATWHIMGLLPQLLELPAFSTVKEYLADNSSMKRLQLSARIADLFDQYIVYRPDMITGWDNGKNDDWQALLWRELSKVFPGPNRSVLQRRCLRKLISGEVAPDLLPERVAVFGISSLPAYHIEIFHALSLHIEVNFYLLNPCQEYWVDILSDREIAHATRKEQLPENALHITKGNALLAATCRQGRDFIQQLSEIDAQEIERFVAPPGDTLLENVQRDILFLEEGPMAQSGQIKKKATRTDRSIIMNSCHSAMREVEVLRDSILRMFEEYPALQPRDILVMAPDIEQYSPLVQAVFVEEIGAHGYLPFSVADRSMRRQGRFIQLFLSVLKLANSRYGINQVLDIIKEKSVCSAFGLQGEDFKKIDHWLMGTNVRWGLDAQNKKDAGVTATPENTWKFALERLLLGYAMAGHDKDLFCGILPYDDLEGGETEIFGKLLSCLESLFQYARKMENQYRLKEWGQLLSELLQDFFSHDDIPAYEIKLIHNCLSQLEEYQKAAGFEEKLTIEVVRSYLTSSLDQEISPAGFISGGITFCSMLPMRAVPFKVVCLLGLNDKEYPRPDRKLSFDKITKDHRPGDRSRRLDDRYIFLEALLSARQVLYVSFIGQSIKDDSRFQPSVLVCELIEYIKRNYEADNTNLAEQLITYHPLQPFHPHYFRKNQEVFFSYTRSNFEAAKATEEEEMSVPLLIGQALDPLTEEFREIQLDLLVRFFRHPVGFFCRKRLGIMPPAEEDAPEEKEDFSLTGLERYKLKEMLLDSYVRDNTLSERYPAIKASGFLPHATLGEVTFHDICAEVLHCGSPVKAFISGAVPDSVEIESRLGDFSLTGKVEMVYEQGLLSYRCAKIKGKDLIAHWLSHLALNATGGNSVRRSMLVGTDKMYAFQPVPDAEKHLENLLDLYWLGMQRPLHFFPTSSYEYAAALFKGSDSAETLYKIRKKWQGNDFQSDYSEGNDIFSRLCFRDFIPLGEEFADLALAVFSPLLSSCQEVSL